MSDFMYNASSSTVSILVVFIIYMLSMILVGVYFNRKKLSLNEYMLGGRQLNPWVTAMSAQASDMSGWLLTAVPALAYAGVAGAKEAIWTAVGLALGTMINWLIVAKRLRVYTEVANNSLTIPSYFENRFKDKKGILRVISAVVIVFFFTFYTASMFSAGAKLFSNVFGLDYKIALLIGVFVIVVYTYLGGFMAVSWTDLVQGILMFVTLILVPIIGICNFTGDQSAQFGSVVGAIGTLFSDGGESFGVIGITGALGWGLGYFGMPHILVRFMACRDKKAIRSATVIAGVWVLISLVAAILVGVVGSVLIPNIADGEQIFMELVKRLFPMVLDGILLSAILAAIMSTADSQLLVASSAFANDIFKGLIRKNATDKQVLWAGKISVLAISLIAFFMVFSGSDRSVAELVSYAWAGFGACFGPLVLFSLYSKRITLKGAAASVITGAVVTVSFRYGFSRLQDVWVFFGIYELVPGFLLSTAVLWIVSLLDRKKLGPDIIADFDRMLAIVKEKSQTPSKRSRRSAAHAGDGSDALENAEDKTHM